MYVVLLWFLFWNKFLSDPGQNTDRSLSLRPICISQAEPSMLKGIASCFGDRQTGGQTNRGRKREKSTNEERHENTMC